MRPSRLGWPKLFVLLLFFVPLLLSACIEKKSTPASRGPFEPGLTTFFSALDKQQNGQATEPLRVVILGDSHIAGDDFSGRLRALLQSRFGVGGRGYLPAGVPFKYYEPRGIAVTQSEGWEAFSSLPIDATGFFDLTGYRVETQEADQEMTLVVLPGQEFDEASITLLGQPNGGRVEASVDGQVVGVLNSEAPYSQALRFELPLRGKASSLNLRTLDEQPVAVLGWTVERSGPGIVVDNIGINGATVGIFDHMDPTWRSELSARDPALVIVAFGTNEGFDSDWTAASYRALFVDQLAQIRRAAPNASVIVIGPMDGNRRFRACRKHEDFAEVCAPLGPEERSSYKILVADKNPQGPACRWHPPPNLEVVREVQRQVAAQQGLFFWDWSQIMGGTCGIHAWVQREPPLAWQDHVHLKDEGYELSASVFYDLLMQQYANWRGAQGRP